MMALLEVRNLQTYFYTYAGVVKAVDGVSFSVDRGEVLGIVGESGSGKSVTAMSIMRLVQQPGKTVGGEIIFDGIDLLKLSDREMNSYRGKRIAMVFQDPMTSLNPTLTVGYHMMELLSRDPNLKTKKQKIDRAIELLRAVGISEPEKRLSQYPYQFSGGMRQRVMIALAIALNPDLLIMDEPTTALDVTVQAQIMELVKEIQERYHMAVIFITHDLGVIAGFADRVMVMYAGKKVEEGDVYSMFEKPLHPYTEALLSAVPKLDMDRSQRLYAIPGSPPNMIAPPPGCRFHPRCPYAMRICAKKMPVAVSTDDREVYCWKVFKEMGVVESV
ncbi:ATP-binding cassette domain-containing protein [bacterium 3DAC]|nr:ABC transporter ATP-binding protein [Dictyoglomota bacterium]UZN23793.1 ATP-binding cassette domain-containing protein [bacterium 3DAC]